MDNFGQITVDDLVATGSAISEPKMVDGVPVAIIPPGWHAQPLNVESHLPAPKRCKGIVYMDCPASFTAYVHRHFDADRSAIYIDAAGGTATAVLNGNGGPDMPGWGDHRCVLELKQTPAWTAWVSKSGQKFRQLEFCDFLDEHLDDIVEPNAASLIEMISALKIRKNAEYHSAVDTKTGLISVQYSEAIRGETRKGNLDMVSQMSVALEPHRGTKKWKVRCRVRLNIGDVNNLTLSYFLVGVDDIIEQNTASVMDEISRTAEKIGCPVYRGSIGK